MYSMSETSRELSDTSGRSEALLQLRLGRRFFVTSKSSSWRPAFVAASLSEISRACITILDHFVLCYRCYVLGHQDIMV